LTTKEFAALGIVGLKSDNTVREYRKAWQSAIDDGQAVEIKPGDTVDLPDRTWPPTAHYAPGARVTETEVVKGFRKMVEADPKAAVKALIQDSPETMPKLAKGVRTAHPGLAAMAATPDREEEEERVVIPREPYVTDYSKDLRHAANAIQRVLIGLRDGLWEPDAMERTLIAFLAMAFNDLNKGTSTASVIDEIEQFLQAEAQR
jgi:hypothetical protein